MTVLAVAAWLLQEDPAGDLLARCEEAERDRSGYSARLSVGIEDKVDESRVSLAGRLVLRVSEGGGRSLQVDLREGHPRTRPVRTVIGEEGAEEFHPFEILRRGAGRWLRERFEVAIGDLPDGALPSFVTGPDGRPLEPRRAGPTGRRRARHHAAAPEEGPAGGNLLFLDLVPREEGLRRRWLRLRVWLDPGSFLVAGLELDLPGRREVYSLEAPAETHPPEEGDGDPWGKEGGRR